jgi:hypothetical protein
MRIPRRLSALRLILPERNSPQLSKKKAALQEQYLSGQPLLI